MEHGEALMSRYVCFAGSWGDVGNIGCGFVECGVEEGVVVEGICPVG